MPPLVWSNELTLAASDHMKDLGKTGQMSSIGSGKSFILKFWLHRWITPDRSNCTLLWHQRNVGGVQLLWQYLCCRSDGINAGEWRPKASRLPQKYFQRGFIHHRNCSRAPFDSIDRRLIWIREGYSLKWLNSKSQCDTHRRTSAWVDCQNGKDGHQY